MRIHVFQHVPFEDIGSMREDFDKRDYPVEITHWYRGDKPPALESFEVLIIMGGPMGIYDEGDFPWLAIEKSFIKTAIDAKKIVIGICLGAQLIAGALGAKVYPNKYKEIGWFPLSAPTETKHEAIAQLLDQLTAFHWHGDTFDLPSTAVLLASSEACHHQAFRVDNHVFGFQFHLEATHESALAIIQACPDDLRATNASQIYIQHAEDILRDTERFARINQVMAKMLNAILDGN